VNSALGIKLMGYKIEGAFQIVACGCAFL